MLITSRAIILSIVRYSDDAIIAEAYTEELGRVGFIVKISRSARAAVKHTLFQPLAVLELTWTSGQVVDFPARRRHARFCPSSHCPTIPINPLWRF